MKHYLSGEMVLKEAWDAEHNAIKMIPAVGTETAIELSYQDGDSIATIGIANTLEAGIHNCQGMKTICLYGAAMVSVSPDAEGDDFYPLTITALEPKIICAMRIKIVGTGKVVICG